MTKVLLFMKLKKKIINSFLKENFHEQQKKSVTCKFMLKKQKCTYSVSVLVNNKFYAANITKPKTLLKSSCRCNINSKTYVFFSKYLKLLHQCFKQNINLKTSFLKILYSIEYFF